MMEGTAIRAIARGGVLLAAMLLLIACGGDSGNGSGDDGPWTATPAAGDANGTGEPDDDAGDAAGATLPAEPGPLSRVAVSTPVLADIVVNVVGERADVMSVIPPGADPHTYEPTPREVVEATESDHFFYMGANLEDYLRTAVWRRALRDDVASVEFAEHLDLIESDRIIDHGDHVHDFTGGDPHIWLDPLRVVELVEVIVESLSEVDTDAADYYRANGDAYIAAIEELHAEYEAVVERIPEERRRMVVFHDAYTYFEERYGFEVIGVVLLNPQSEPPASEVAELHGIIEEAGLNVVFREPQYSAQILEQLARDRGIDVGLLMTDTFTDDVTNYLDLMRFNLQTLETHLAAG